ncbi:MAG: calcium/sodium antiporter [Cryomorphaceae bacterium]
MIALFLLGGFALLLVGGEFLVRGSVGIALKLRVSKVVIGLTLVAFATSAPELLVSVVAATRGKSDIALGNVIGSNIANIGLILGLTALVYKMKAVRMHYRNDWLFLLLANALLAVFLFYGGITTGQGLLLVALLVGYNIQKIRSARRNRNLPIGEEIEEIHLTVWKGVVLLIIGALGLSFGAKFFVSGISALAIHFGMTERFVAVTVVAFGTSVPELAASFMAARKGESDIAIGNIIGSNIFNILSVLGFTALVQPITLQDAALFTFDFHASVFFTLLIIPLMSLFTKDRLDRLEGALLLGFYLIFISSLVF